MGIDMLTVETTMADRSVRIGLVGELTAETERVLRQAIRSIDLAALERAEFDLSGLDFVDSTGLAALARVRARLAEHLVSVNVVAPSPTVRRMIESEPFEGVFTIVD
jgi:anti-anti-sigma factor